MQKQAQKLKNKVIIGIILCSLINPVYAQEEQNTIPVTQEINNNGQVELVENQVTVKDLDIEPLNTKKLESKVIPDTKKEAKKVMKLFIKAMIGVAFCSVLLYVVLLFIRKFYASAFMPESEEDYESYDLSTPSTKQDALKSFLDKTR